MLEKFMFSILFVSLISGCASSRLYSKTEWDGENIDGIYTIHDLLLYKRKSQLYKSSEIMVLSNFRLEGHSFISLRGTFHSKDLPLKTSVSIKADRLPYRKIQAEKPLHETLRNGRFREILQIKLNDEILDEILNADRLRIEYRTVNELPPEGLEAIKDFILTYR